MNIHEKYINRCIEIAKNGLGSTRPNPMVGSVIVHNHTIIGEGFTSSYGGNHAEVNAINAVVDKHLLKESTLYVTLEPCSHFGKTPPCSDLIVEHNIPNVVIGCMDDNIKVAGKGIEKLKNSGCNVTVGILEAECREHHKRFFTFHNKKRPYIILKWAESSDGFMAPETKNEQKPVWISNDYSRQLTHKWRAEEQAILVGTNTVLQDNPSLTVRDWTGQNPIRIVLDKDVKLSKKLAVFNEEAQIILISKNDLDFSKQVANKICNILFQSDINSVIIEGGRQMLQTFLDEDLWDEARIFIGSISFNKGIEAPHLNGKLTSKECIMGDILNIYRND
ncbi:bifunctional diaminohydroxyphosphoribosylaminopyrimidine deaminase/5-amino-6-(5-phosphoribosylamino)uracil reductase RibD [Confluentibacter sediminis]|uniref:bifunctional diaminohydroxyphosphoribosylaminopyrimidine deaminase/5-amino-6-(5-phosphoribosylamino)uracil reductase RibD n=1 Tax=Confluentibacter sediminis TaxID=2219045 RepID=UPI000DAB8A5A|nr:bifunctional diaminohydroxyphosphoribosylaminopyrimidine deaminase/5-amino-6-(5-phosphoribosylamino)uracil reductase RibD [Confluentibacter sediminis]